MTTTLEQKGLISDLAKYFLDFNLLASVIVEAESLDAAYQFVADSDKVDLTSHIYDQRLVNSEELSTDAEASYCAN